MVRRAPQVPPRLHIYLEGLRARLNQANRISNWNFTPRIPHELFHRKNNGINIFFFYYRTRITFRRGFTHRVVVILVIIPRSRVRASHCVLSRLCYFSSKTRPLLPFLPTQNKVRTTIKESHAKGRGGFSRNSSELLARLESIILMRDERRYTLGKNLRKREINKRDNARRSVYTAKKFPETLFMILLRSTSGLGEGSIGEDVIRRTILCRRRVSRSQGFCISLLPLLSFPLTSPVQYIPLCRNTQRKPRQQTLEEYYFSSNTRRVIRENNHIRRAVKMSLKIKFSQTHTSFYNVPVTHTKIKNDMRIILARTEKRESNKHRKLRFAKIAGHVNSRNDADNNTRG